MAALSTLITKKTMQTAVQETSGFLSRWQKHKYKIKENQQDHEHKITENQQDHEHKITENQQEHYHKIVDNQQNNSHALIASEQARSDEKEKNFREKEKDFREREITLIDEKIRHLEETNNRNMQFMAAFYQQREEYFNGIIFFVDKIKNEIESSLKEGEDEVYNYVKNIPHTENIKEKTRELSELFSSVKENRIKTEGKIEEFKNHLIRLEERHDILLKNNPSIKIGILNSDFFSTAKKILTVSLTINKHEIDILKFKEDEERIEKDLKDAEQILKELESQNIQSLIKIASNLVSARKLSRVMPTENRSVQASDTRVNISNINSTPSIQPLDHHSNHPSQPKKLPDNVLAG